jgi:hypothetical protein
MAVGSATAPFRIPGKRSVTFVAVEPFPSPEGEAAKSAPSRTLYLRQLDVKDRRVTTLSAITFACRDQDASSAAVRGAFAALTLRVASSSFAS